MTAPSRPHASLLAGPLAAVFVAGCGAGAAAIVGSASGDSGSRNAPTTVGRVTVLDARTSPAVVSFTLFDEERDVARVRLRYLERGAALDQGVDLLLTGAPPPLEGLSTLPEGKDWLVTWDFAAQLGAEFHAGLQVVVTVNGEDGFLSLGNSVTVDVGNDAAEVLEAIVPAAGVEAAGPVPVPILLRDSGGDPVDLTILFERPDGTWAPARPAGDPERALDGLPTDADGLALTFVWDSGFDLRGEDREVRLEIVADDGLGPSVPLTTPAFHVDNNARPAVRLLDASLIVSDDEREGLAIPFQVTDVESDPTEVVLQWRVVGSAFPALELEPEALRAVLADPARRRELQVVTERPIVHQGRVGLLPAELDALRHVRLPELGGREIHAVARGLAGRVLEFPRALVPCPIAHTWSEPVLVRPAAALATDDGLGALVLDEPSPGAWRLREIELETGATRRDVASGPGTPAALAEAGADGWLVGLNSGPDFEVAWLGADGSARASLRGSAHGISGPLRGLAGRGTGGWLASAGSALVEGRFSAAGPSVWTVLNGLAEPWGVVVDPDQPRRAFVAERHARRNVAPAPELRGAGGGVLVVDLVTRAAAPLAVEPGLPRPTALALNRARRHLYVLTDGDPEDAHQELVGLHLAGPEARTPFRVAEALPRDAASLALGPRDLRLLALPRSDDLAVGGGVGVRRTVRDEPGAASYDVARQVVALEPPLRAAIPPGSPWTLQGTLGAARSSAEGAIGVLLWDLPADLERDADILVRAIPLDQDVGLLDESIVSKRASVLPFGADSEPLELATQAGFLADLELADLDADDLADLALSAPTRDEVVLYFLEADGSLDSVPDRVLSLPAGSSPRDLACGDLNGDGRADLLVACGGLDLVAVFLQGPDGLPDQPSARLELEGAPSSIELADLDRDGRTDVLVSSDDTRDIRFFTRDADGGFVLSAQRPRILLPQGDIVTGDVDGDGDVDIVGSRRESGAVVLFPRQADGTYPPSQTHVFAADPENRHLVLGDVNGDGADDLVAVSNGGGFGFGSISVFFLGGAELPEVPDVILPLAQGGQQVALRDLDRNGETDFVLAQKGEFLFGTLHPAVSFHLQRNGVFEPFVLDQRAHTRVVVEDLGADGSLDILALGESGAVRVWKAASGGVELDAPDVLLPLGGATPIDAADFDGNGLVDLLGASSTALSVRLQESPRLFEVFPSASVPALREFLGNPARFADLDGDGRLDLVGRSLDGYRVHYQRGTGGRLLFEPGGRILEGAFIGIEDFDGDGRYDLAFLQNTLQAVTLHLGQPSGTFAETPDVVVPVLVSLSKVQLADVNADGRPDLLAHSNFGIELEVFLGVEGSILPPDPDPSFSISAPSSFDLYDVRVEDMDRDGLPDLVFSLRNELAIAFQRSDGFPAVPDVRVRDSGTQALGIGDLEGDGDLDVVSRAQNFTELFAFPATAPRRHGFLGSFGNAGGSERSPLVTVDLDLDGSLDVISTAAASIALRYGR